MNPDQILNRFRTLTGAFTPAQIVTLGLTFVLVVGIVAGSAWWLNAPAYSLLFADMDPDSAGDVVTRLKNLKVPYKLDEGGRAVRVPSNRVDELRLELTSQGLPQSGRIGFEIFDRTAFGATEFLEKVNYRRALEGEIARTVATISEVASARVHIAMGKDSLFGEPRPAKASVILKLRGQRALPPSAVAGITGLVAASVEGLRPEAVVILDSMGRPLSRPAEDENDPLGAAQLERQQRLERDLATRVVALLEPVVGADRVRVNVALKLNPQTREETEERWDPNSVVRSRQTTSDISSTAAAPTAVAGARGNMPPPAPPVQPPGTQQASQQTAPALPPGPGAARTAETTSYEISRTTRHVVSPPGEVARLSVAVILDDDQVVKKDKQGNSRIERVPRSRQELQKIQGLVAAAVGLDSARGDQLTVENVGFDEPPVEDVPPPTIIERYSEQISEGTRTGGILLLALLTFLLVIRPLVRRIFSAVPAGAMGAAAATPALAGAAPGSAAAAAVMAAGPSGVLRTVEDIESEIEAQLEAQAVNGNPDARRLPVLTRRVTTLSAKEPDNVAKLLRSWMTDQDR